MLTGQFNVWIDVNPLVCVLLNFRIIFYLNNKRMLQALGIIGVSVVKWEYENAAGIASHLIVTKQSQ